MTTLKDTGFNEVKTTFYGKASNILIYKSDRSRKLPTDQNMLNKYRDEVVEKYNAMAALAASIYETLDEKEKEKIKNSFEKFYKPRLIEALNFIGFMVEAPENFDALEIACIADLPIDGAAGGNDDTDLEFEENESFKAAMQQHMQPNDDERTERIRSMFEQNQNNKPTGLKADAKASRVVTNTKFRNMNPNDFDNLYSLDPKKIAANRNNFQNWRQTQPTKSNAYPNAYPKPRPPNPENFRTNYRQGTVQNDPNDWDYSYSDSHDEISVINFYNLCARTFTETYSGDPLALKPFINQINMVQRMCQNEGHEAILKDFIMSHVKGLASDILPADPDSVDTIKKTLLAKIKPENSKVVRGKLMALKADKNNLTEFAKKAEQLADNLKRSLILEGIPYENANKMVIDNTIDLCRSNTTAILVKAGLIGPNDFKDSREVLAKYITETRKDTEEKQILSIRQTNTNRNNGNNYQRRGNGRNYYQGRGQNQGRNYQNYGNYRGNYQSRGNSRGNGNGRGRGSGYRGRGNYYQQQGGRQNRTYYYAENDRAPPSGAQQAQNVQMSQADRQ